MICSIHRRWLFMNVLKYFIDCSSVSSKFWMMFIDVSTLFINLSIVFIDDARDDSHRWFSLVFQWCCLFWMIMIDIDLFPGVHACSGCF